MLKSWQEVLEYAFGVFNEEFFDGELPPVVITLQSSPRSNGHFTCGKVWRAETERMHEINISVEHLDRPIENIMGTLMHEAVHFYCEVNGIQDTSQNGRYHNRRFKEEAEKRGLIISQGKYIGWSVTTPGPRLIEIIERYGITKPIDLNRDGELIDNAGLIGLLGGMPGADGTNGGVDGMLPKKPKCSTRKYQCPCCLSSFRATRDINVLCMDCNEQFVKVEK